MQKYNIYLKLFKIIKYDILKISYKHIIHQMFQISIIITPDTKQVRYQIQLFQ